MYSIKARLSKIVFIPFKTIPRIIKIKHTTHTHTLEPLCSRVTVQIPRHQSSLKMLQGHGSIFKKLWNTRAKFSQQRANKQILRTKALG